MLVDGLVLSVEGREAGSVGQTFFRPDETMTFLSSPYKIKL
jgi:hypothetical protein